MLAILRGEPQPSLNPNPDRFPLIAFAVENLDEMVGKLNVAAVELPWGIEGTPDSPWIMLDDPAGNLIEIAQPPTPH